MRSWAADISRMTVAEFAQFADEFSAAMQRAL